MYVLEVEMLEPWVLARKHNFGTSLNCCDIPSISKKQYQVIRYHHPIKPLDILLILFWCLLYIDSNQYVAHQYFTTLIIKGRHLYFLYQVEADVL